MNRTEYEKLKAQSGYRVSRDDYENLKKSKNTNGNEKVTLSLQDGKEFGTISSNAYRAISNGLLDYYNPVDDNEKKVLDSYKEHISALYSEIKPSETETKKEEPSGRDANFWDLTVNSLKRGYVQSLYGQESYKEMTGQKNNKAYYEEKLKSDDYSFIPDGWFEKMVSGGMELFGQQVKQWTDPRSVGAATAAATATAIAGQAGPQVLAPEEVITVPTAFIAGMTAGSSAANFEIEAGHAYNEMIENGISPETAKKIALGVGAGNAALEALQVDDLLKSFKILNKTNADNTVTKKLLSYLTDRGISVAKETAQEVAQESVTLAGVDLARGIDGKEAIYSWGDVGKRLGDTAASSALSFAFMGAGGDAINYGVNKTAKSIDNSKKYTHIGKIMRETDVVQAIINTGLESPKDSAAFKLAEKAQLKLNKKDKLSDYDIGKLYYANVEQIEQVDQPSKETAKTEEQTATVEETSATVSKKETVETSTVAENTTVAEPVATETPAPVSAETTTTDTQRNTFTEELDDIAGTEMPTVSVGDTFVESGTGKVIKVVDRNESTTSVEITLNGKTEIKPMMNKTADRLAVDDKYTKVETTTPNNQNNANLITTEVETPQNADVTTTNDNNTVNTPTEKIEISATVDRNEKNISDIYKIYGADAELITEKLGLKSTPVVVDGKTVSYIGLSPDAFEIVSQELNKMGITFKTAESVTSIETPKNITLNKIGNSYEVYGEDAITVAEALDLTPVKKVINGVETDAVSFPVDFLDGLKEEFSGEYNFITSTPPATTTNSEKTVVTDETVSGNEVVASTDIDSQKKAEKSKIGLNKNELRIFKKANNLKYGEVDGQKYITDGSIVLAVDENETNAAIAEYESYNSRKASELDFGPILTSCTSSPEFGTVAEVKSFEANKKIVACVVNDIGFSFNKDYVNLLKKRGKTLKVLSDGTYKNLGSTILVSYDKNGNLVGLALSIKQESETVEGLKMFTGKELPNVKTTDSKDTKTETKAPTKKTSVTKEKAVAKNATTESAEEVAVSKTEITTKEETAPATDTKATEEVLNNKPESDTIKEKETPIEETTDKVVSKGEGSKQIADYVANKLAKGEKISALELQKIATEAFGGTMANNAYSIKDAYDAMELGVNQHILSMKEVSADKMLELLELLPTQTKRTEEMVKFQQFSTPPSIAYLANYTANVNSNDIMLEPSAGIGGIAVFAKKDDAKVYVNELDNRRLEVLKNMPFDGFFNEDAEQIDNILGGELEPTVIVMNPPFSSSAERNMHKTKIGAKHIEQALKILAPNGRLVAIVGKGMADGEPAFRTWWKDIKSQYNVRANIGINGKNYNKYGTNFDIQMLVIDKNGPTEQTVTGYVDTLQELQEKLGGIRDERPAIDYSANEQRTPATTRTEVDATGKTTDSGNGVVSDTGSLTDKGKSADTPRTTGKSTDKNIQSTDAEHGKSASVTPDNTDVVADKDRRDGSGQSDGLDGKENSVGVDNSDSGQSDVPTRRTEPRKRVKHKELTDSIFEQYQPQPLRVKNAQPHPARVSESAAMSAIEPPAITYKPNIPQDIIDKGVVSDVQLEAISYAGQSHSQTLPNGTTRGFFLGDGTGIGKGRTIAGMMLDNFNQGRKKAVWVTLNSSLVNDAKRDVKALFGDSDLVTQFVGGNKADSVLNTDEAIMVISYSALSKGFDNKGSNFEKIVNWLGKDFDGLIVFDEAHKMGNATSTKGTRGMKKASQTGIAGISLQEALPKAKIVYSSATGATEVENLRYAERLGLWGEGTPFIKGDDFVSKVKAGGLAAMELIARDMKAMGVYLSRNISYDDVQYDKITHKLTAPQTKIYDELARSWQIVLQNINKALESTNQDKDGHARGRALGAFWSSQQRFFNQILTSMQVPSVISDIEKQLADGKSCVIQLVSTNEAAQNQEFERLKSEDLELDEFDLTPKQVLMSLIENSFPVQQFEEYRDDNGNVRSRPVFDSKGNPVINREAVKQRDELLAKLGSIKVPSSPIDMIINHFGTDLVAENTGRARRVIQKDGKTIEEKIGSKKDADVDAFQNGNKRIIIFSKAGGTGKSYHADKSAKNQQQRVHYLLEAGWQADNAVQGFGRSHRSNQASAPIFKLVTTNLKGQMRFISTIAKRLDQLGAMTKGQRQAGGQGMFSASDNLENSFAADVLAGFYKDLVLNKVDGIDDGLTILEKLGLKNKILDEYNRIVPTAPELREVNKFLNRILSLESDEQNTVFEGYSQRLQDATEKAMLAGTLDKGLENYKADKITLNEVQDIREDERSGAKTKYYNLTAEHKIKPVKFDKIPTDIKSFVGFYQNKNTGAVRAVYQTSSTTDQYGNVSSNYKLMGQVKNEYIPQHRFYGNWDKLEIADAEKLWNEEVSKLPEFRKENLHLISGVVLPVWDKLPTENVRIYRVLTSDGEMLIGRVVSEDMIDETLRRLGSSRKKEKIATKDLVASIKNGDTVYLDNGWKIVQRKVSGENRIELMGPSYEHHEMLMEKGVFAERIQYRTRYFVPADTNTEKIIDDILKISPVMRVENADSSSGVHYSKQNIGNNTEETERWNTKRVEGSKDSKDGNVNIADIVKTISEKFGIPIATGKVTSPLASAQYNERAESIRVRIANDLPDIAHELGHHLDKKYGFRIFDSIEELKKVVPQDFLDQYPEKEWNSESVGWFVEQYLRNTNNANRLCKDFYADFVSALSKEDLKAVNEIANAVNEYLSYNISERYDAAITNSKKQKKEKVPVSEKLHELRENWVDPYLSIKDAVSFVEEAKGHTLSGKGNAYILATNSLNAHSAANYLVTEGFRDLNGNIVDGAKSFLESISMVDSKDMELLDKYLVLRHSLEWIAPKQEDVTVKRVFADDTLENVEEIEKHIAEIEDEHPEIKTAAENLYEYQNNVLKHFVIPTGAITEETLNTLNRKYPSYVPFYRAVGKDSKSGKAKSSFVNQKSPIKRAKGSGELIISPLESIIKNTEKFVKVALRNQTADVLGHYADTIDGFGKFMEPVPPDMIPHTININKIKDSFLDELQNISKSSDDYFAVSDLFETIFGDSVMDFTPIANANKKIVTVLRGGTPVYYQVHDDALYKSIAELAPKQLEGFKAVDFVMNTMKLLITQNNPIFAVSNVIRDFGTAYKLSPTNNPVEFTARYLKALAGVITNSDDYKQYKAMGGGHSSELTANIENISKTLRKVAQKDMGKARRLAYAIFAHPVETAAMINDKTESIARFAEFVRTLEANGDLQEAIFNANDLTTNFRKQGAGTTAKVVNKFFLFNNAAIQGLDKTARTLANKDIKQRNKTWMKWLLHALIMGIVGYLYNREVDEEGYKNLSSYKKNNFYNFAIGDGNFISLPKPRENGLLDSVTERAIEYMFGNDEAFYDFGSYLSSQLIPPMLPDDFSSSDEHSALESAFHSWIGSTAFGGLTDIGFNRNFMGIPIEGKYDEFLPSNERYNENTTKIAYELGQTKTAMKMGLSPKKIDHLISSYTGIIGQVNKALFPMNKERKDVTIGLRNKFLSDSNYSTDLLNKMYDNRDKAEFEWQYDNNIKNAIEYEQNAVITSYISGMNKAIKALPEEEQREGRKYLLKALNNWNYDMTTQQSKMQSRLENESISKDYIFEELPSSEFSWTVDKKKYTYQMTPQEYNKYVSDYLKVIENARKQYGGDSLESYAKAKEAAKDYMSNYKKQLKGKYLNKATKSE